MGIIAVEAVVDVLLQHHNVESAAAAAVEEELVLYHNPLTGVSASLLNTSSFT